MSATDLQLSGLPSPVVRPVYALSPDTGAFAWLWELQEDWAFTLVIHSDRIGKQLSVTRLLNAGFLWDGASKPLKRYAVFATPSSHWAMVAPSAEHDDMCRNQHWWAAHGVSSADAAWHFYQRCTRYHTGREWRQWKAVLHLGPKWNRHE